MSSYSFTFAFECKESKSVKKKRLCEMPGAKIAPLVPRKVRGQFFSPAFCFPLDKLNEKGITHVYHCYEQLAKTLFLYPFSRFTV